MDPVQHLLQNYIPNGFNNTPTIWTLNALIADSLLTLVIFIGTWYFLVSEETQEWLETLGIRPADCLRPLTLALSFCVGAAVLLGKWWPT
jgi:hypothetical protein